MGDRGDFWWAEYLGKPGRREPCAGMETLAEGRRHSASPEAMKKHEGCENAQSGGIEPLKLHAKVWKVIWGTNDYRDHLGVVIFFLVAVSS